MNPFKLFTHKTEPKEIYNTPIEIFDPEEWKKEWIKYVTNEGADDDGRREDERD